MCLTPPGEARTGGKLLDQEVRGAYSLMCDCPRQPNGVLQLVHQRLDTVVDTRTGDSIEGFEVENIPPEDPEVLQCCREAFNVWRPRAWQTAGALGTLAVTLFCSATIAGIVEEKEILWITSLSVVALLLVAAFVVSVLAYRNINRIAPSHRDDDVV